ncbi:MAG: hypothetical protein A2655_03055 [Candidatus Yanofskybacteria bacterium RIFCSPHIGHO2_01_FULL_43_42]|uniref:Uncharacterized protein n=1 Tax=Candidatus Yanofskybacteria bacterium RIFCSPLOWO2_01_FULL_43_22 TaxID=1802695 RepID=A0A1F8GFW3_9BACT|nr:MAG: hypothetical protein A2655_03055 [Candidatus Yanofskybacteria bacterium RIFCSPHIGHO2_01_FULL_43_42]OGN12979.1 MAG: hypothetical protein A3D48_03715 [Candidatus Yanofskybacteria bacterium RIFCSPHIGHO2_02_FULL_43_17]OGN23940.1 MAG: hypothetical protein A3A13_02540 [Candidatus Yanofskybacteria bacterium RIFCSPLOWO2_01_FULL_43_22]
MPEEQTTRNTDEEVAEEEQYADELAAEQELYAAQAEAVELYNQGQTYHRPSLFKYSILASLAVIVDIVDFIDLTGLGAIVGRIISFAVSAVIILIFWFTNTKQKRADEYAENIQKKIDALVARIANAERNILRVARLSRKIPGAKQLYRKLHLRTVRRARVALRGVAKSAKSPILRSVAAGTLNLVPFLALVPWMLVGIWLSYRAEKESYKNAREASDSVLEATGETGIA